MALPRPGLGLVLAGVLLVSSAVAAGKAPAKTARRATKPYAQYVRAWHTPAPARSAPTDSAGRPLLVLYALNTSERIALPPASEQGGFAASDLDRAAALLRDTPSGNQHPVEPRLLDVVYRVQAHFQAQEIRVVSCYRTARGRPSNHSRGRAIDIVVPGASDAEVAKFARELGFVGVGVYTSSGFVHIDVRERSYFWIDASGPGRRNRERGILADVAQRSDAQAAARGERPVSPFFVAPDLDAALRARGALPAAPPPEEDEDLESDGEAGGG